MLGIQRAAARYFVSPLLYLSFYAIACISFTPNICFTFLVSIQNKCFTFVTNALVLYPCPKSPSLLFSLFHHCLQYAFPIHEVLLVYNGLVRSVSSILCGA